jgi:hypothetical protein
LSKHTSDALVSKRSPSATAETVADLATAWAIISLEFRSTRGASALFAVTLCDFCSNDYDFFALEATQPILDWLIVDNQGTVASTLHDTVQDNGSHLVPTAHQFPCFAL